MSTFKIATWNVNSLRVRLPHVLDWLKQHQPDVLALQELKMQTEDFPHAELQQLGYQAVVSGQKTYNGVAVISKLSANNPIMDFPEFVDPQRRVLAVTIGDIRVLNLYVPNGESVTSEKYQYKLNWFNKLNAFLQNEIKTHEKVVVLGDFNIAPEEIDVHDPLQWQGSVLFSDLERQALRDLMGMGFVDCFRTLSPDLKEYSWWDYRMNAFKRNIGLRIDHILSSKLLSASCVKCYIDKSPRALERPSDHAPVVAEFNS